MGEVRWGQGRWQAELDRQASLALRGLFLVDSQPHGWPLQALRSGVSGKTCPGKKAQALGKAHCQALLPGDPLMNLPLLGGVDTLNYQASLCTGEDRSSPLGILKANPIWESRQDSQH